MHLYCGQWQNTQCSFKYFEQCICKIYLIRWKPLGSNLTCKGQLIEFSFAIFCGANVPILFTIFQGHQPCGFCKKFRVQCNTFITLSLGSIGMDHVISELCYKGTILQRNYRKMTILWSFSYKFFVNLHGKMKLGATT